MENTVAKKLEFVMMAFVIMASLLRCATGHDYCGNVSPILVDIEEQEEKMYSERVFTLCDMYDLVGKAYPFDFETELAAEQRTEFQRHSDWDTCCPTWHLLEWPTQMTDVKNETCYIIQLPDIYQSYKKGTCEGNVVGKCTNCVQQYKIHSMVAWCPAIWGIKRHDFRVPAYCSCQSNP